MGTVAKYLAQGVSKKNSPQSEISRNILFFINRMSNIYHPILMDNSHTSTPKSFFTLESYKSASRACKAIVHLMMFLSFISLLWDCWTTLFAPYSIMNGTGEFKIKLVFIFLRLALSVCMFVIILRALLYLELKSMKAFQLI